MGGGHAGGSSGGMPIGAGAYGGGTGMAMGAGVTLGCWLRICSTWACNVSWAVLLGALLGPCGGDSCGKFGASAREQSKPDCAFTTSGNPLSCNQAAPSE